MLILQIILTGIAWFRGWKWYSLFPITIGFLLALGIKYFNISPSNTVSNDLVVTILNVIVNISLLFMCIVKKPTNSETPKTNQEVNVKTHSKNESKGMHNGREEYEPYK